MRQTLDPAKLEKPIFVDISDYENNENISMKRPMYDANTVGRIIESVMKSVADAVDNVHTSGLDESESMRVIHECDQWEIIAKELQRVY
jgi:hypothetical protein